MEGVRGSSYVEAVRTIDRDYALEASRILCRVYGWLWVHFGGCSQPGFLRVDEHPASKVRLLGVKLLAL